jgi:hypothetical protein
MAIYPTQSNYIVDVDIITTTSFKAGMALMRDDNGRAIPADNATLLYLSLQRKAGKFLGFASSDHDAFGNTIIVPDVIGSSYLDENRNFVRFENPEVRTIRRALPDLQDPASNNINPTDRTIVPKRGIGVYNQSGEVYITDQFVRVLHGDFGQDFTTTVAFNPGDLLTFGSGVNAGKLVKVNVNSIGTDIVVVGVVVKYIPQTDLLHFTNAFYSVTFSGSSAVMALDAGNLLSFPSTGYIGTVCGITLNEPSSMTLTAPVGHVFDKVLFASYGTPTGSCGSFAIGSCHAASSQTAAEGLILGKNTVTIVQNGFLGLVGDPCIGTGKSLYIQARFAPISPTIARDLTVNNNNGTLTNGVAYDSTDGGGSWSFDGTNDYINIPRAGLVYGTGPKALMAWAKLTVATGGVQVIASYGSGPYSTFFVAAFPGISAQAGGYNDDLLGGTITLNTWFHICNVYNGTTAFLYLNGSLVASAAKSWNIGSTIYDGKIGAQIEPQQYWNGNISDVRLYNRALSASEVLAYYNYTKSRYGL